MIPELEQSQKAQIFDVINHQMKRGRFKAADIHAAISSDIKGKQLPSSDARVLAKMAIAKTCVVSSFTDGLELYVQGHNDKVSCQLCPFLNASNMCTGGLQNSGVHKSWLKQIDEQAAQPVTVKPFDVVCAGDNVDGQSAENYTDSRLMEFVRKVHGSNGDIPIDNAHLRSAPQVPCLMATGGIVISKRKGNVHNCKTCPIFEICDLPKNTPRNTNRWR